jgi:threonine dehydratase
LSAGPLPVGLGDVRAAQARIAGVVRRTPVHTCAALDRRAGRQLFFKCEMWQGTGSFKLRGASNALASLPPDARARGVITHSSGNFGAALACAGQRLGVQVTVVVPEGAPALKRAAMEGYGADLISCGPRLEDRAAACAEAQARSGATFVHPSDDPRVIAGQGTLALELFDEVPWLDAVIAPLGGGGLLGGVAVVARALRPGITVLGAEPAGADDAHRSKAAGQRLPLAGPARTLADGLRTELGVHTWPLVRDLVDEVLLVDDEGLAEAVRLLLGRARLVVEPSGAAGLAALLRPGAAGRPLGRRVGVILSGGNIDPATLASLLS